jgi:hypothetical protein
VNLKEWAASQGVSYAVARKWYREGTLRQERALRSHAGAARVAFNWGLARVKANLDQRAAERTYGIGEAEGSWEASTRHRDSGSDRDPPAPR